MDSSRLVLMGNWYAKVYKGWVASRSSSGDLVNLIDDFVLVHRYQVDHTREEL